MYVQLYVSRYACNYVGQNMHLHYITSAVKYLHTDVHMYAHKSLKRTSDTCHFFDNSLSCL